MKSCDENGLSTGQKIDDETASNEFERFSRAWDIQSDVEKMTPEDRETFKVQKNRVVAAIVAGRASVDEAGDILYTLAHPGGSVDSLHFVRPKALAYLAMDDYKDRQSVKKLFAFMAVVTGQPVKFLSNLDGVDAKFLIGVATLFLAS